jgi:hypothetical protein
VCLQEKCLHSVGIVYGLWFFSADEMSKFTSILDQILNDGNPVDFSISRSISIHLQDAMKRKTLNTAEPVRFSTTRLFEQIKSAKGAITSFHEMPQIVCNTLVVNPISTADFF